MNKHKNYWPVLFGLVLAATIYTACGTAGATQGMGAANTDSLLQAKRFVFIPQTVNPTGGRTRQVTADFFFRVSPDTVYSYLPYFGRVFTAPITSNRGAMDFTLTDFQYQATAGSKNRHEVTIRPNNGTDVRELILQVSPNGYATLIALSNNRQQISYNGYIQSARR